MTWKICIRGLVQGVGFRPFVWRAALDRNIKGSVANGLEGVVIKINGTEKDAAEFQEFILNNAPEMARITHCSMMPDEETFFGNFTIEESDNNGDPVVLLTSDVAMCPECQHEIHDTGNRRYRYAFTTCTVCGPRYSIQTGVPYDRKYTTMQAFDMCPSCKSEYNNPDDRRFFAQPNSCKDCGILLELFDCQNAQQNDHVIQPIDQEAIIHQVNAAWKNGLIVAIKGIGGYLLTCDAANPATIAALRSRKHRPTKPFALLYPTLGVLQQDAVVMETDVALLLSPAAPIVLLPLKETATSGIDREGIAPGLSKIGAMLPNSPLLEILLRDFGRPIVATSGNTSNAPLIYKDETAIAQLTGIADYMLMHNREILMPQDDSLLDVCQHPAFGKNGTVVLRRSRGLAPTFLQPGLNIPNKTTLALGAELKSTFTLAHLGNLNVSQYLGDLSDFEVQERFQLVLNHLLSIFDARPTAVLGDLHPEYFTTRLGQSLTEQWQIPFIRVQHHEAHFAAVLAENNLFDAPEDPVLGVVWDGTGLGHDGQIWGGEFFTYSNIDQAIPSQNIRRLTHFGYFPFILGDKMPREPRLSALATCFQLSEATDFLRPKFNAKEWGLYQKLPLRSGQLMTSSVGRIFDAVASLIGLADKVSYEGEAAMLLEDLARRYCNHHGFQFDEDYINEKVMQENSLQIKTSHLFGHIIYDLNRGNSREFVAAKFHFSMVKIIRLISAQLNINKIAFSGGVFQNTLLLDMLQHQLAPECHLFFHRQLSPNDENISFGQWAHYTFA